MPIYSLYLSTLVTTPVSNYVIPQNKTNLSNVSWLVDWDNLFRKNNYDYKYCRVRFNLITEAFTASSPATLDWAAYSGYVATNLASSYNANTTNGTILGVIFPTDCPVTGTGTHCILANTCGEIGADIVVPTGTQQFNIMMIQDNSFSFQESFKEYSIMLLFELYNE